jgi:serine/threonine-protein kinase
VKKINYQESDDVKKNTVIIQYPVANIAVRENVKIAELTVSLGRTETVVPNVINFSLEEAKEKLDNEELRYSVSEEASSEVPVGYVVRQNPTENYTVSVGSIIELYVSSGPSKNQVSVPKLIGKTTSEAKALIKDAGLEFGIITYEEDKTKSDGIVLSQSQSANKLVDEGTVIDLVVNKKTTVVPEKPTTSTQKIYLNLMNKGVAGKEFTVKIEMSSVSGKQVIYEEKHTREDKEVLIEVSGRGLAMLEVYIDGRLDSSKEIVFK